MKGAAASYNQGVTDLGTGSLVDARYQIIREFARGGASSIFLATDTKFGVPVALKISSATGEAYQELLARFQREARISYLLGKASGFVRAIDWGHLQKGQSVYLVLDFVEDARHLDLRSGPLEERLKRLEAAAALVIRAHALGIVHRDLKPSNFLVAKGGGILLNDFGMAKSLQPQRDEGHVHITKAGALVGTPLYMSPEQFSDPRNVGVLADVYALGVMLYHCLTGKHPYPGQTAVEIVSAQVQVRYGSLPPPPSPQQLNPEVDDALDRLCMDAIDLELERRCPSVEEFLRRLQARGSGGAAAGLSVRLGLDREGFTKREALDQLRERLGEAAFLTMLEGAVALAVEDERPVEGVKRYEGRVAFLFGDGRVTLGRTEDSDISINLVTVSKQHVHFQPAPDGWTVVEAGSSNGTCLEGVTLEAGAPAALRDQNVLRVSQHLSLRYLEPASLVAALSG